MGKSSVGHPIIFKHNLRYANACKEVKGENGHVQLQRFLDGNSKLFSFFLNHQGCLRPSSVGIAINYLNTY